MTHDEHHSYLKTKRVNKTIIYYKQLANFECCKYTYKTISQYNIIITKLSIYI